MKHKELTNEIFLKLEEELRDLKVKSFADAISSDRGLLVYECLELMYYRGKFVMPTAYEYRRELTSWYRKCITYRLKCWSGNQ